MRGRWLVAVLAPALGGCSILAMPTMPDWVPSFGKKTPEAILTVRAHGYMAGPDLVPFEVEEEEEEEVA